jgi:hypothetical protein
MNAKPPGMTKPKRLHHAGMTNPTILTSQLAKRRSKWTTAIAARKTTAMVVNGFTGTLLVRYRRSEAANV